MDDISKMVAEADVLRQAYAIIKQYRGGLETTLAVIEETEQALRAKARQINTDEMVREHVARHGG